jgi:hypothetical protein
VVFQVNENQQLTAATHSTHSKAVATLVIKFFNMAFQNSPLFSDAICKLFSHSLTGKVPHILSAEFSSIFFNIRNNL